MKMRQNPRGQQGFSLVELLVAMTILSVGLFALAQMQTVAAKNSAIAHKISASTFLCQEALEDIMSWSPDNASLNADAANVVYANNVQVAGGGAFNITYSTTRNTPAIGTTRVVVTVTGSGVQPLTMTGYKKVV